MTSLVNSPLPIVFLPQTFVSRKIINYIFWIQYLYSYLKKICAILYLIDYKMLLPMRLCWISWNVLVNYCTQKYNWCYYLTFIMSDYMPYGIDSGSLGYFAWPLVLTLNIKMLILKNPVYEYYGNLFATLYCMIYFSSWSISVVLSPYWPLLAVTGAILVINSFYIQYYTNWPRKEGAINSV